MDEREIRKRMGSFNWYLNNSGSFVTLMAKTILVADHFNLERIELVFPQMVAAFKMKDWDQSPKNFPPEYNALVQ